MSIGSLSFKNPAWYHALVLAGSAGLISTGPLPVTGIDKHILAMLFIGLLILGCGEWINHPEKVTHGKIDERSTFMKTTYERNASALGIAFSTVGLLLSAYPIYYITLKACTA